MKGIGPQGLGRSGNNGYSIGSPDSAAKIAKFKNHKMYGKDGEVENVKSKAKHNKLDAKGYGHSAKTPAKQVSRKQRKLYKETSKKFPDFNQATDTILTSKGYHIEDNLLNNSGEAKFASSYLFNKDKKNNGKSKTKVKYTESDDDKSFRGKNGTIVTHSLYKKDKLKNNASSPAKLKDACYKKVKAKYDVFPSAYASGAIAKCRKNS